MKLASKVVIFGVLDTAELAHWYLENDSFHTVVAFTVNKEYLKEDTFKGLPVVPFEELEQHYPPSEYRLFAPMTGVKFSSPLTPLNFSATFKNLELTSLWTSSLPFFRAGFLE